MEKASVLLYIALIFEFLCNFSAAYLMALLLSFSPLTGEN